MMAFKDERGGHEADAKHKAIRLARAQNALGPWPTSEPFVSPRFTEGPTIFRAAGEFVMLFDHFTAGFFGAIASPDLENWRDVSEQMRFPAGPRHAGVIEIDDQIGKKLETRFGCY
jgi:hypothetical protein